MQPSAHSWFERKRLKAQLRYWRSVSILLITIIACFFAWRYSTPDGSLHLSSYIAQVNIDGIITDDERRNKLLREIAENNRIKAVIVRFNTPGGTTVGGEELYTRLREISQTKPVVALMRTLCASAGYMAALGADHIIARETTLTGSIGVILQSVEFSGLAEKIGVSPITYKAGEYKDNPSSFRKPTDEDKNALQPVLDDTHDYFINLVQQHRKLKGDALQFVTNGRIFTGRQAQKLHLVDTIGGEDEALAWLASTHQLDTEKLKLRTLQVEDEFEGIANFLKSTSIARLLINIPKPLDGLLSIWHPNSN